MSEPDTQQKSEALMREGLDHYAMGDDARAIACWQQVLELDPDHAEAQDYLRTATEDVGAVESPPPASEAGHRRTLGRLMHIVPPTVLQAGPIWLAAAWPM